MITPEVVKTLRASYHSLINMFSEYQFIFANKIFETDFVEGDRLIVFDDSCYTISALAVVYEKTKRPLIIIKDAQTHEVVVEKVS